jgi:hypothetical protein
MTPTPEHERCQAPRFPQPTTPVITCQIFWLSEARRGESAASGRTTTACRQAMTARLPVFRREASSTGAFI